MAQAARGTLVTVDLGRYFERIGLTGPAAADLETLERLHALHPEKIAFENLSPFLGEAVKLDPDSLQEKLVRGGRGGWCFEHNLLFSHVQIRLPEAPHLDAKLAAMIAAHPPA